MTSRQETHVESEVVKKEHQPWSIPRLSVILCTYNRCNLVLSTLASLRRQTLPYDQFEVIVVDNGSTDGTLRAVRTYVQAGLQDRKKPEDIWRVHCLSEPQNGLVYARKTGLLAAAGEIAVFLDDDAIASPHFLERLLMAYGETGADAIGGRVEIRWEASRPHWLSDELLDLLGYFAPSPTRMQLKAPTSFSNSNLSVKIEALDKIGSVSPLLSKRLNMPTHMESQDLCNRLYQAGYTLWYEPEALVIHRAPAARLTRAFFVGRAYWRGRSEVLARYLGIPGDEDSHPTYEHSLPPRQDAQVSSPVGIRSIFCDLWEIASLALFQRPLLRLAGKSSNERLFAAMAQARSWGRLQQRLQLMKHAPAELTTPAVLFVRPAEPDPAADLLVQSLAQQGVSCTIGITNIPLAWLWQHRAHQGQAIGIVHFHRPGAFDLTQQQRQQLLFRLWLARHWGVHIVTTDSGGWWQSALDLRFFPRRSFERKIMRSSDILVAHTPQPEQLYPDKKLRCRVHCLPHPGFRDYYGPAVPRTRAHQQLGLPSEPCFVYLCLVSQHTEQELVQLIEAFQRMPDRELLRLLLVGSPQEKKTMMRLFKFAALNPAIDLFLTPPSREDIPLYMGAMDAIVLPHLPIQVAGTLETALLALFYGRIVVAPNLPRFRGMLPPQASILYDPTSRESLVRALVRVQTLDFQHNEVESASPESEIGWGEYAQRLSKLYNQILKGK